MGDVIVRTLQRDWIVLYLEYPHLQIAVSLAISVSMWRSHLYPPNLFSNKIKDLIVMIAAGDNTLQRTPAPTNRSTGPSGCTRCKFTTTIGQTYRRDISTFLPFEPHPMSTQPSSQKDQSSILRLIMHGTNPGRYIADVPQRRRPSAGGYATQQHPIGSALHA